MTTPTIQELHKDYEPHGGYLRRKDASIQKPSPVLSVGEVLAIAVAEIRVLEQDALGKEIYMDYRKAP